MKASYTPVDAKELSESAAVGGVDPHTRASWNVTFARSGPRSAARPMRVRSMTAHGSSTYMEGETLLPPMSTGFRRYSPRVRTSISGESSKSPTLMVFFAAGVVCAAETEATDMTAQNRPGYARTAADTITIDGADRHGQSLLRAYFEQLPPRSADGAA